MRVNGAFSSGRSVQAEVVRNFANIAETGSETSGLFLGNRECVTACWRLQTVGRPLHYCRGSVWRRVEGARVGAARGVKETRKMEVWPSVLRTSMVAPWALAMRSARARPRPWPSLLAGPAR